MRAPPALHPTRCRCRAPRAPLPGRSPAPPPHCPPESSCGPRASLCVPPPPPPRNSSRAAAGSPGQLIPPHSPPSAPAPSPPRPRGRSLTLGWFTLPPLWSSSPPVPESLSLPGCLAASQPNPVLEWPIPRPAPLCPLPLNLHSFPAPGASAPASGERPASPHPRWASGSECRRDQKEAPSSPRGGEIDEGNYTSADGAEMGEAQGTLGGRTEREHVPEA
ncbi:uncharacterized protein LOC125913691 [Panthera uncia]|uniref:uncharacterized protein LOC125913691 n=1 Tax=Panthera uncia TaxID=29064 RepID=UPI0020FFB940|nr:uncharacterized protein LOC125913691 [Panthera uncia]